MKTVKCFERLEQQGKKVTVIVNGKEMSKVFLSEEDAGKAYTLLNFTLHCGHKNYWL